jgi:maltose alpha-D-glucosyltransferase/alpha-amylase
MRLNLGIRRRLAPLLANDRSRIELANSLLFTLPGSPVIYYGDEIGMGDDIWLEDRDGVRTPMQWSAGGNAGFSYARPEGLYTPVLDDDVYGYMKVNVESQRAEPNSLLNQMRRMIQVRKAYPALGRGDIRFLESDNQSILAYLRGGEEPRILVINNLSARPQTAELDLAPCAGARPVDLFTDAVLPRLETPHKLKLDGYQYFWLRLS